MVKSDPTVAQSIAVAACAYEERLTGRVPRSVTVVLSEETLDDFCFEQSTLHRARVQQQVLQVVQLWPRQPISPGSGETHLLTKHN